MLVDYVTAVAFVFFKQKTAYEMIRYGGTVVTAGLSPAGAEFSFNQSDLVSQEKSIKGSYMGGCVPVRDIPRFIDLYRQGRLPVDRLIDRTIRLEEINAGFDKLASVATVRQIEIGRAHVCTPVPNAHLVCRLLLEKKKKKKKNTNVAKRHSKTKHYQ